jgi:hypothetical protein
MITQLASSCGHSEPHPPHKVHPPLPRACDGWPPLHNGKRPLAHLPIVAAALEAATLWMSLWAASSAGSYRRLHPKTYLPSGRLAESAGELAPLKASALGVTLPQLRRLHARQVGARPPGPRRQEAACSVCLDASGPAPTVGPMGEEPLTPLRSGAARRPRPNAPFVQGQVLWGDGLPVIVLELACELRQ